jgi:cell division protein FtsB
MKIGPFFIEKNRLILIFLLVGFIYFVLQINNLQNKLTPLQNQAATARVQATDLISTQNALVTQIAYATSPAAVEDFARGEAHMIKPGDNPVAIVPIPGDQPTATADPAEVVLEKTPLETWLLLLFGN